MTNVHIVILGLLRDQPLHGYEIKQIIEEHMADWTDIKFGSIYFALSRLKERGLVEVLEETQEGNRPARTVYRITDKGRIEFHRLLTRLWEGSSRTLYPFDIGLFFIGALPQEAARKSLEIRIRAAREALAYLWEHRSAIDKDKSSPKQAGAIIAHTAVHMEAELLFLEDLQERLEEFY